jgi:Tol biopolymer transport system component
MRNRTYLLLLLAIAIACSVPTESSFLTERQQLLVARPNVPDPGGTFAVSDGIERMKPDGSSRKVVAWTHRATAVDWAPDYRRIVFAAGGELRTVARDGSDPQVIYRDTTTKIRGISWSPAGDRIAVSECGLVRSWCRVFSITPEGGGLRSMLTEELRHVAYGLSWSPDGTRLAYAARSGPQSTSHLYWIPRDGGTPVRIDTSEGVSWVESPAWSPNGKEIAFTDKGESIWLVGVDGSNLRELTTRSSAGWSYYLSLAWSPTGSHLAFIGMFADSSVTQTPFVYVSDASANNQRRLALTAETFALAW